MISVISPIYDEADNLAELYERTVSALEGAKEKFELILIDNGSRDRSLEIIKSLRKKDPRVKFLSLSRNFGHQGAIAAGLAHASGDAVISLDGDLQHPPELIPKLIGLWRNGYEVVYTTKKKRSECKDRYFIFKKIFYRLMSSLSDIDLLFGQSDYRLLDRKVVDALRSIPEKNKFLRGMVKWVGFSQVGVEYGISPRKRGRSKFSVWQYLSFAADGIFSFSVAPLRIFLWVGVVIASLCIIWGAYYFVVGAMNPFMPTKRSLPPGWVTITVSVLFLGGVQLIGIGCLGEYIGRVYSQTKERPDFIVREKELA